MKSVDRTLVRASSYQMRPGAMMVVMLPKVVTTGSIPMTGVVVGFVIVLVEDPDHLEVEEEQEGDGDPEQRPQVDPDAKEVVFIEEPHRFGTQIGPRLGHLDQAVETLSLSLFLGICLCTDACSRLF